jgi:hypothetical protein
MSKELKKSDTSDEDDAKAKKVERKATTMYFQPAIFDDFKSRVVREPGHGYQIVEEMVRGYLAMPKNVVAALWKVPENKKKGLYKAVEAALTVQLKELDLL